MVKLLITARQAQCCSPSLPKPELADRSLTNLLQTHQPLKASLAFTSFLWSWVNRGLCYWGFSLICSIEDSCVLSLGVICFFCLILLIPTQACSFQNQTFKGIMFVSHLDKTSNLICKTVDVAAILLLCVSMYWAAPEAAHGQHSYASAANTTRITVNYFLVMLSSEQVTVTCSTVEEGAKQLHLRLQLSQPKVNGLVVEDGQLEDLPLLCVLDGVLYDVVHRCQDWRCWEAERGFHFLFPLIYFCLTAFMSDSHEHISPSDILYIFCFSHFSSSLLKKIFLTHAWN